MIRRRRLLQAAAGVAATAAGVGLYTWRVEPHWVQVVECELPIRGLPRDLVGGRLVQLSDLHLGPRVDDGYLKACFDRVGRLKPDLVVYTGDFTSYTTDVLDHARDMFGHLARGRRATYAILGNHDYGPDWACPEVADGIAALAGSAGVRVLRNEVAEVGGLHVVGLDDVWADRFDLNKAFSEVPEGAATVVLSHNPDTADLKGWGSFAGWILSGHTHGGQCRPPFLPPPLLPVVNRRYTAGAFELSGGRRLYINRGLGHLLRVRFNVRPEITVFQLARV